MNNAAITIITITISTRISIVLLFCCSAGAVVTGACAVVVADVAPFILRNGTWQEITPFTLNVAACTVEFAVISG